MAPFEALYGLQCHSPIGWFEPGETKLYGTNLVREALEKVLLNVSSMKGIVRFVKKVNLIPRSRVLHYSMVQLDESLGYEEEPIAIIGRQVCQLRSKKIAVVKVQWRGQLVEEVTWEAEEDMSRYPHFFSTTGMILDPFEDERLFKR
ncbi:uncharacterized protein [Nicotiana tomentosiformis]|uniref:uncharacterized protein n=1 Tax=Nicotiana tomentosiformis TaxID=4098 RepID=UPI00388C7400